ncbi:hypothetical protein GCM10022259_33450 [Aquimarina mytili]
MFSALHTFIKGVHYNHCLFDPIKIQKILMMKTSKNKMLLYLFSIVAVIIMLQITFLITT